MNLRNTLDRYGSISQGFHWLVAFLVIGMLIGGFFMGSIANDAVRAQVYMLHKSTGLVVLFLMGLRILWVLGNVKPTTPPNTPLWERIAEHSVHGLLYLTLLGMPLSGWIMSTAANKSPTLYQWFTLPFPGIPVSETLAKIANSIHLTLAWIVIGLLIIHIAAAIKHHWMDQDNVLRRMLPSRCSSNR
ncbi:MAG: cytochrome b [Legionellales bacterium]|nr:cytochrome b [Legionellales bacterium]